MVSAPVRLTDGGQHGSYWTGRALNSHKMIIELMNGHTFPCGHSSSPKGYCLYPFRSQKIIQVKGLFVFFSSSIDIRGTYGIGLRRGGSGNWRAHSRIKKKQINQSLLKQRKYYLCILFSLSATSLSYRLGISFPTSL